MEKEKGGGEGTKREGGALSKTHKKKNVKTRATGD